MINILPARPKQEWVTCRKEAVERLRLIEGFDQEVCCLITLSPEYRVIADHLVSLGSFHGAMIPLQVILNRVIQDKAKGFIIGHNHPNGVGIFSQDDVKMMMRLMFIADLMELVFVDSIILPRENEASSMEKHYPKLFRHNYIEIFNKATEKLIPKKLLG